MTTAGSVTLYPLPQSSEAGPITRGPDGNIWFGSSQRVGRVLQDGEVTEFSIPYPGGTVRDLAAGADGALWYVHDAPPGVGRVSLLQGPDLAVKLSTNSGSVQGSPDGILEYKLEIANNGNQDATGVVVNQLIPVRTRFLPAESTPGWSCSPDNEGGGFCTFPVGDVPKGAAANSLVFQAQFTGVSGVPGSSLYTRSTIADDRSHGIDLNIADNDASVTVPELATGACTTTPAGCCVVEMLSCFFSPDPACTGGSASIPGVRRALTSAKETAVSALAALVQTARGLVLYYRMRDEIFARTPGGRRLTDLYYRHDSEIKSLLLADPALRDAAWTTLNAWAPRLQDVVNGSPGSPISQGQVDQMARFLDSLAAKAGPDLASVIARERQALGLDALAGLMPTDALQRIDHFSCTQSDTALCLNGGRFRVEASWTDFQGHSGVGHTLPMTADTGAFWFFSPANIELVTKALDGRAVNGNYWFFYGALSNVAYTITVTDTATGAARTYANPSGHFGSAGDTTAFPGRTSSSSRSPFDLSPEASVFPAACTPGAASLCLNGGRFRVEVAWKDFQGNTGSGHAVPLTSDTGTFWFFNSNNVELVVKTLDGRALNGKFWVFYGALSNVEYSVTVTDTQTGAVKTYGNPPGVFASVGDTGAF